MRSNVTQVERIRNVERIYPSNSKSVVRPCGKSTYVSSGFY